MSDPAAVREEEATTRPWLQSFLRGLRSAGALSTCIALAVVACCVVASLVVISPSVFSSSAFAMVENSRDKSLVTTRRVLQMWQGPPPKDAVFVLGDSRARSALNGKMLDEALNSSGNRHPLYFLLVDRCHPVDMLALFESLPPESSGRIVILPSLWANGAEELDGQYRSPKLGLRSERIDEITREHGGPVRPRWNNYLADNLTFYLPRLQRIPLRSFALLEPRDPNPYLSDRPIDEREWKFRATCVANDLASGHCPSDFACTIFEELLGRIARTPSLSAVVVWLPYNPRLLDEYDLRESVQESKRRLQDICLSSNADWVDLADEHIVTADDYLDPLHIRSERATHVVTQTLSELLSNGR